MTRMKHAAYRGLALSSLLATALTLAAQVNPNLYAGLQWRNVGPFHGGRISSVTGVVGEPGTFYFGSPLGGIWKTTSAGVTWFPIFDEETSVDSVGAIQVAPSNPAIVYAGAGDPIGGSLGNGMWKSTDAGKTWQHIGLEDTVRSPASWSIPQILTSSSSLRLAMQPITAAASIALLTAVKAGPASCKLPSMTVRAICSLPSMTPV